MSAVVTRRKFDIDEYHWMVRCGIIREEERVELINGEIIEMAAIGSNHAWCVNRLNRMLVLGLGERAYVAVQNSVILTDHTEPEPDFAVLRPEAAERHETPRPRDIFFVIEVADSSLHHDRHIKLPLYAAAGIAEVWIVDLRARRVEVYREPGADGYGSKTVVEPDAAVSPLAFPDLRLSCSEILGKPAES